MRKPLTPRNLAQLAVLTALALCAFIAAVYAAGVLL